MHYKLPDPPKKPGRNATEKALSAFHSELRRYRDVLETFAADLEKFSDELNQRAQELADRGKYLNDDKDECDCGPQDALDGCECDTCTEWRALRVHAGHDEPAPRTTTSDEPLYLMQQPAGDEVNWLEGLYKLKDRRKT
jgi:hypothetical protein